MDPSRVKTKMQEGGS